MIRTHRGLGLRPEEVVVSVEAIASGSRRELWSAGNALIISLRYISRRAMLVCRDYRAIAQVAVSISAETLIGSVNHLDRGAKHITGSALSDDEFGLRRIGLNLAAQSQNLDVDRTVVDFIVVHAARFQ
jgi:hypothetical protein